MKKSDSYVIRSMTAFGQSVSNQAGGVFQVEIQCVNRRFLDINVSLPREMAKFELEIRKWIAEKIGRGQVNVRIHWRKEKGKPIKVEPNFALAEGLRNGWEELSRTIGIPFDKEGLIALLTRREDLFFHEEEQIDDDTYLKALKEAIAISLQEVYELKKREGNQLAKDLDLRVTNLGAMIDEIELKSADAVSQYGKKLKKRLDEWAVEDKERWSKEVALFADRVDISEEIVRLKSHRHQFLLLLKKPLKEENECRGKTLDFFLQEMMREANTIGAKAQDASLIQLVVLIKGELEKVREQLQNVE